MGRNREGGWLICSNRRTNRRCESRHCCASAARRSRWPTARPAGAPTSLAWAERAINALRSAADGHRLTVPDAVALGALDGVPAALAHRIARRLLTGRRREHQGHMLQCTRGHPHEEITHISHGCNEVRILWMRNSTSRTSLQVTTQGRDLGKENNDEDVPRSINPLRFPQQIPNVQNRRIRHWIVVHDVRQALAVGRPISNRRHHAPRNGQHVERQHVRAGQLDAA